MGGRRLALAGLAAVCALAVPAGLVAFDFDLDDYLTYIVVDSLVGSLLVVYLIFRVASAPIHPSSDLARFRGVERRDRPSSESDAASLPTSDSF
jgi:hypothetical protein